MAQLLIQSPGGQTRTVPLTTDRLTVGRSSTADLSFPEDSGLSRQHMMLAREGNAWFVEDLGSKNGTFLNEAPVKTRTALKPGDRVTAGHLVMTFEAAAAAAAAAARSPVVFVEEPEPVPSSTIVTSLAGVMAGARGARQVQALIKAGTELASDRPLPEMFRLILDLAIQAVGAQRGALMTVEDGKLVLQAHKGEGFRISTAVRDRVMNSRESMLVRDTTMDEALRARMSIVQQRVATLMAAPLQTRERIIGLIYLDSPNIMQRFGQEDLELLTVMANVAAVRIEHVRLGEIEAADRLMRRELEQAAEIQRAILPAGAPVLPGVDLAGYNAPCRTVGGDYYDFVAYPNGSVAMLLGDVSGKGMPASLLMMGLQARVRVLADEPGDLGVLMARLNRSTCANCPSNRFITLFLCMLDAASGEMKWSNAGHNPPVVVRASGEVEFIQGGGPVLGFLRAAPYRQECARLAPGDLIALYSDGITEAANPAGEEFGEERLGALLAERRNEPAASIIQEVTRAVAAWSAGAPPADDITIVVARKTM
jgi:serine phosphatase RsbU (regulator of sigma subunit)